jgi:hypothetical protein
MVSKDTKAVKKIIEENLGSEKKKVDKKPMKKTIKDITKKLPPIDKKENKAPLKVIPPFKDVEVVIKRSSKFNWVGIFRKLNSIGKALKIIGDKSEKEYFKNLWNKYCIWWNNKFNKKIEAVPVSEDMYEDIKPMRKNYENYLEINDIIYTNSGKKIIVREDLYGKNN